MARHEVPIQMGEVPVIRDLNELNAAVAGLAVRNAAYSLPETIDSPFGALDVPRQRLATRFGLELAQSGWYTERPDLREVDAGSDIGMHGNPYFPGNGHTEDYIHFHHTPVMDEDTVLRVTFADSRPGYMNGTRRSNRRLTDLLREGKTDPRLADPDSFRQVTVHGGQSVLFRLSARGTGLPLLHSFDTVGPGVRQAEITRMYQPELTPTERFLGIIVRG